MTDEVLASGEFRALLLARKADLDAIAEGAAAAADIVELDQSRVGRLTRMDALQAQAMARETGRRRHIERLRIDAALARIDADSYGYCVRCEEPIAPARLRVDPAATLCLRCAEGAARG